MHNRSEEESAQEEAHYFYILTQYEKIIEEKGVRQVWNDMAPYARLAIEKEIEDAKFRN